MGMTASQLALVGAVAENNLSKAKSAAVACCAEDITQKNSFYVSKYSRMLQAGGMNMLPVSHDIEKFAVLEDLSTGFNEKRYFLSEDERKLFEMIQNMYSVAIQLMEKQIPYLNATLLYGESGVGKTAFSRYVAYKLEMPYLYVNLSQMVDSYLGGTVKNLSALFNFTSRQQCVLMLDEIDSLAVGRKYADSSAGAEISRSTTCLLQLLDAVTNDHIIIAATNLPDSIDNAVKRRFTQQQEIKKLSAEDNYRFIEQYMADVDFPYDRESARRYAVHDVSQAQIMTHITRQIASMLINKSSQVIF